VSGDFARHVTDVVVCLQLKSEKDLMPTVDQRTVPHEADVEPENVFVRTSLVARVSKANGMERVLHAALVYSLLRRNA